MVLCRAINFISWLNRENNPRDSIDPPNQLINSIYLNTELTDPMKPLY
jgi:hypothetical protein